MRFRTQVFMLLAALAVAAVLILSTNLQEWLRFGPRAALAAPPGSAVLFEGREYQLTRVYSRATYADGTALPPELRLVVADVELRDVSPLRDTPSQCIPRLWVDGTSWFDVAEVGVDTLPGTPDRWGLDLYLHNCYASPEDASPDGTFSYRWGFVVPAEALAGAEDVSVDVTTRFTTDEGELDPRFPRLEVDPELLR